MPPALRNYLTSREGIKHEIARKKDLARVPVTLPDGSQVALSPGGQNPLIKAVIEQFCPAFAPGGIVHYPAKNWLLLIEAVTSAGPVDGKRRKELKQLFAGCKAGLVFVTAFETRRSMQSFLSQIAWESEVWVAEDPDHMIHFNGERFLGPYPDVMPE